VKISIFLKFTRLKHNDPANSVHFYGYTKKNRFQKQNLGLIAFFAVFLQFAYSSLKRINKIPACLCMFFFCDLHNKPAFAAFETSLPAFGSQNFAKLLFQDFLGEDYLIGSVNVLGFVS